MEDWETGQGRRWSPTGGSISTGGGEGIYKMIKKYDIVKFEKVEKKITRPITKFGGQPIGIKESQWPISKSWNDRKMMFVGQILLEKGMLWNDKDLMIYIFVTHPDNRDDDFFDPDVIEWNGGENAVLIQPLEKICKEECPKGPALFDENNERSEYISILKEGRDPEFITRDKYQKLDDHERYRYDRLIDTDKIGGPPNFFRGDEWPEGEWKLLLQLHCNFQPFVLDLGAMPILFVFISSDLKDAGLLVQG